MGEAPSPCFIVVPRRAAAAHSFRLPRRKKVHVVRLGGGGGGGPTPAGARVRRGHGRGLRLRRWLRRAAWRLAELCVATLSGQVLPGGAAANCPPWTGVEPYLAAPFFPVTRMKRAGAHA